MREYLPLFGRMGISLVFILMGLEKCLDFDAFYASIGNKGIPLATILLVIVIAIEFVGGIAVAIGIYTKPISMVMAFYLVVTTALFHPIWLDLNHFEDFVKNLAILGGLLTLAYHGPGPKSLDTQ